MSQPSDTWFAFDDSHRPARIWRMVRTAPDGPAEVVAGLDEARKVALGHPLVTHAHAATPALPLPAAPADLNLHADGDTLRLGALTQAQPHTRLCAAVSKIQGFLQVNKDWDGVLCLPGFATTVWSLISANEVVSVLSFTTAPLVEALSPIAVSASIDSDALISPLQDVISKPETLGLRLAESRSLWAAGELNDAAVLSQTWGAALGAELAAARAYWLGQNLALIAPSALAAPYKAALSSQYVPFTEVDEAQMTIKGLASAYAYYKTKT
jgi:2-dehydro-3-deoxygalactonokinase